MRSRGTRARHLDAVVLVFCVGAALFTPPVMRLWASDGAPWLLPYGLWLAVIAAAGLLERLRRRHGL